MSTKRKYADGGNYATPAQRQTWCGHTYRTQTYLLVVSIARLTGQAESQIWKRIYQNLEALYGIYLPGYPRRRRESLLRVAERYDVLDKVYAVAYAERLNYLPVQE